jgi:hypothetical protein
MSGIRTCTRVSGIQIGCFSSTMDNNDILCWTYVTLAHTVTLHQRLHVVWKADNELWRSSGTQHTTVPASAFCTTCDESADHFTFATSTNKQHCCFLPLLTPKPNPVWQWCVMVPARGSCLDHAGARKGHRSMIFHSEYKKKNGRSSEWLEFFYRTRYWKFSS